MNSIDSLVVPLILFAIKLKNSFQLIFEAFIEMTSALLINSI
jgi:hypothetical protein